LGLDTAAATGVSSTRVLAPKVDVRLNRLILKNRANHVDPMSAACQHSPTIDCNRRRVRSDIAQLSKTTLSKPGTLLLITGSRAHRRCNEQLKLHARFRGRGQAGARR
jgi:hypothetical protein